MTTPIVDFVSTYEKSTPVRFHMPGHKGKGPLGCEKFDITEIAGADVLYAPDGIIAESEANATALFGTAHSFYSTEGSTLTIKAMLALAAGSAPRGTRPLVLAPRNVHKAFLYAAALLDLDVKWLTSDRGVHPVSAGLTAADLEKALARCEKKPCAVYVTSPDYLGNVADIAALSAVCDRHGVPLLVDNAHGAYLKFLPASQHPMDLGATMCADSAHKTLPVLTGGAYLHIAKKASGAFLEDAREALSLFASTSPSYLILQSLDACNLALATDFSHRLSEAIARVEKARAALTAHGYAVCPSEPMKLVIDAKKSGYTGTALAGLLAERQVLAEFADADFLVLMCSPENGEEDFARLLAALLSLLQKEPIKAEELPIFTPVQVFSPREAMLAPAETVAVETAAGRICAAPAVSCPPAVPILMSGERIDETAIRLLRYYGYNTVRVVREA